MCEYEWLPWETDGGASLMELLRECERISAATDWPSVQGDKGEAPESTPHDE